MREAAENPFYLVVSWIVSWDTVDHDSAVESVDEIFAHIFNELNFYWQSD
jgi:hypothetical protein